MDFKLFGTISASVISLIMVYRNTISENEKKELREKLRKEGYIVGNEKEFYDYIVDITSLKSLSTDGWNYMVQNQDEKLHDLTGQIVSFVGNYNKGKTFLLQLLCKINTPHNFHAHTAGLSVKYIKSEKHSPVIALDTAGYSLPIYWNKKKVPKVAKKDII